MWDSPAGTFPHGSTFGAHPVATAVAVANMTAFHDEDVFAGVLRNEGRLRDGLRALMQAHPWVKDVRALTDTLPAAGRIPVAESWRRQARASRMRVVLADGDDKRAIDAAQRLDTEGLAIPVLLGDPAAFRSPAVQAEAEASPCNERIDLGDPLHVAALMVAAGEADACVGGATRPTADVVRAARYCIGPAPGVETISSCFLLVLPNGTPITFGDCAVVPEPDAGQLASIAMSSAATHESLVGERARVAMLSYSTKGSAAGPRVERVRSATEIVRRRAPSLAIDGELQFDAAWAREVARSKAPGSEVAGSANVFVFPDLDSGNIAYKITERLGVPERTGRCCRAPHASCTTCRGPAMRTTSSLWPSSRPARPLT